MQVENYRSGAANTVQIPVFGSWQEIIGTTSTVSPSIVRAYSATVTKHGVTDRALIPDWAATITASGSIAAIGGFIAAWFLPGPMPVLVLTCGLVACAIGMRAAEHALAHG
jgi:hypothetical protein